MLYNKKWFVIASVWQKILTFNKSFIIFLPFIFWKIKCKFIEQAILKWNKHLRFFRNLALKSKKHSIL